jgi:hypothetical protein
VPSQHPQDHLGRLTPACTVQTLVVVVVVVEEEEEEEEEEDSTF